jgi:hypothetical protein
MELSGHPELQAMLAILGRTACPQEYGERARSGMNSFKHVWNQLCTINAELVVETPRHAVGKLSARSSAGVSQDNGASLNINSSATSNASGTSGRVFSFDAACATMTTTTNDHDGEMVTDVPMSKRQKADSQLFLDKLKLGMPPRTPRASTPRFSLQQSLIAPLFTGLSSPPKVRVLPLMPFGLCLALMVC